LTLNFNTNIDTLRFRLRKIEIEDTVSIFQYASDPEIDKYVGWDYHKSIDETAEFVKSVLLKYEQHEPADWGKGVMSEVVKRVCQFCFEKINIMMCSCLHY